VDEARHLFCDFANVEIQIEYLYGEGYGKLFKLTPRWIYDLLSARWGWHLMIASKK
jgi:hypothetical protein